MSDINDWAREQAEKRYPATWQDRGRTDRDDERDAFKEGVGALADAFLSDEAVEAAAIGYWKASAEGLDVSEGPTAEELERFAWATRIVVQAAVDAVTKEARND